VLFVIIKTVRAFDAIPDQLAYVRGVFYDDDQQRDSQFHVCVKRVYIYTDEQEDGARQCQSKKGAGQVLIGPPRPIPAS